MNELLTLAVQVVALVFLVDFLSGCFHWLEDAYGSEQTPVLGRWVVLPNVVHHRQPRHFVHSPFWRRNRVTMILSATVFVAVATLFGTSWQLGFVGVLGAFANEFHCWAHRSPPENGRLITALHRLRLLQTPVHHALHHADPKNRAYCVLTNYTNPLLDRVDFWRRAEALVALIFRVHPRPDLSLGPPKSGDPHPVSADAPTPTLPARVHAGGA